MKIKDVVFHLSHTTRICLVLGVSLFLVACSGEVTEFEDKSPAPKVDLKSQPVLAQEIALNYDSFAEAKRSLEGHIESLSFVESLSEMEVSVDLTLTTGSGESNAQTIRYDNDVLVVPSKDDIASHASTYLESLSLYMNQVLQPPKSTLQLGLHSSEYNTSFLNEQNEIVESVIERIDFLNGENSEVQVVADEIKFNTATFNEFDPKVIKNLSAQVTLAHAIEYKEVELTDASPATKIYNNDVSFRRISSNQIELKYSSEIEQWLVDTSGWHTDGKALSERKSSGNTLPNPDMFTYFKAVRSHYESTLDALTSGEFISATALSEHVKNNMPIEPDDTSSIVTRLITYHGPVDKIRLVIKSKETQQLSKKLTAINPVPENNKTGYYLAVNDKQIKFGLVNQLGEWFIRPDYNHLEFNMDNYFHNHVSELNYRLDVKEKALTLIDFKPFYELSSGLLVVRQAVAVTSEVHNRNKTGVLNTKTNQLLIPMNFSSVDIYGELIKVEQELEDGNSMFGVYTINGDQVVPVEHSSLKIKNNYVYTKSVKDGNVLGLVFDKTGKQLVPSGWSARHYENYFSENKLLLVNRCIEETDSSNYTRKVCEAQFLDEQGNVAITLEHLDYKDVGMFSNGYAVVVNKKGLSGYINTKGKLVIPFKYKVAASFQKDYALVTMNNGDEVLIDSKERVFKNFKDTIRRHQYGYDEAPVIYVLKDGKRYDGNGRRLSDIEPID